MNNIILNFFYQIIFQLVKILIPIITIPIASRAVGASGIGLSSYSNSIVQYFVLIASLGISLYGNREIARTRDSANLKDTFVNIFLMKLATAFVSLLAYLIFLVLYIKNYQIVFLFQSIYIFSVVFDVSWFYMGIEDFKKTSLSSLLSQIVIFVLIVFFVKNQGDTLLYIIILGVGNLLSQIIPFIFVLFHFETNEKINISISKIKNHFIGSLKYFIPQVGILLYSTLNKTLLGYLNSVESVGYYTNSMNLITAIITVITTVDYVLLPKMSNLVSKDMKKEVDYFVNLSIGLELFFSIPAAMGIVSIARFFVPLFFGNDFLVLNYILPIEAILIIIVPIGVSISRQYLIPLGNTKDYTKSIFLGSIINVSLSLSLISIIGVYGAIFSNIIAELFVTIYRLVWAKKNTGLTISFLNILKIIFSSIIMSFVVFLLIKNLSQNYFNLLIIIIISIITYILCCYIFKVKEIDYIKNKLIKRK